MCLPFVGFSHYIHPHHRLLQRHRLLLRLQSPRLTLRLNRVMSWRRIWMFLRRGRIEGLVQGREWKHLR